MTKLVNPATFIETAQGQFFNEGTVEVTIHGKTRRVSAVRNDREITAYGIAVKYQTGTKVWAGRVSHFLDTGNERMAGGFDNRATNSRIQSIVGFWDDVAEQHRSRR